MTETFNRAQIPGYLSLAAKGNSKNPVFTALKYTIIACVLFFIALFSTLSPLLTIAGIVSILFFSVMIIRYQFVILLLIIGIIPLQAYTFVSTNTTAMAVQLLSLTKLLFFPLCGVLLWNIIINREPIRWASNGNWALIFAAILLVSLLFAANRQYAFFALRKWISVFLLYFAVLQLVKTPKQVLLVFLVIMAAWAVSALAGLSEVAIGKTLFTNNRFASADSDITGLSSVDANTFAAQVLVALSITAVMAMSVKKGLKKFGLIVLSAVFILSILFTYSRGGMVSMLFGMFLFLYYYRKKINWLMVGIILIIGVAIGTPFLPDRFWKIFGAIRNITTDFSLWRRLSYHIVAPQVWLNSPIWGIGPLNFPHYYTFQEHRFITDVFHGGRRLHNMYLSIFTELGVAGFGAFMMVLFSSLRKVIKGSRKQVTARIGDIEIPLAPPLLIGFSAFLLCNLFLPAEFTKLLWLQIALCGVIQNLYDIKEEKIAKKHIHEPV